MPKVIAINMSERKGEVKHSIEKGIFMVEHGLLGDAHAGKWHRQVSLLAIESINKLKVLGFEGLTPGIFAENITTEGIVLYELPIGTKLSIGTVEFEVTQIGKECHKGCEIRRITGDCVMPREGIFTKVIKAGEIMAGDEIRILSVRNE